MSKKYTIMFFGSNELGKVKTFSLPSFFIIGFLFFVIFLLSLLAFSVHKVSILSKEKTKLLLAQEENSSLRKQVSILTDQLGSISQKIVELDNLENKIRELVNVQKGVKPLKPIAVGGREVDLLTKYSSMAVMQEADFFDSLSSAMDKLTYEISQREMNLSELVLSLEEKRLIMSYTPTIMPVKGWISSPFGYRISPFTNRQTFHEGVDIAARLGSDVYASGSGIVIYSDTKPGFGKMVVIDHGYGYITKYGHNSELLVKVGDKVQKGQTIAKVGSSGLSTGAHLHYEIHVNGLPVDPQQFIVEEKLS